MLVKFSKIQHLDSVIATATFYKNNRKETVNSNTQENREKAIDNLFYKIRLMGLNPFK